MPGPLEDLIRQSLGLPMFSVGAGVGALALDDIDLSVPELARLPQNGEE